jgi:(p)ppGpp synthase/HD superfamily hydrolase
MNLTDRFADALGYAEKLHRDQTRKGNDIPYVAHLLAVAATVLEWGCDEDTAIAALLHDAVEDQGGLATAQVIRERFGDRVADVVLACTDSVSENPSQKPPWEARKRAYIAKLARADRQVALITAADKLHNLTAIVRDVKAYGPETLTRFNAPDRLLWYYTSVIAALATHDDPAPLGELQARARELAGLLQPQAA